MVLTGCVPLVVGGVATTGVIASKDKGFSGTFSDSDISMHVKNSFYKYSPQMHAEVGVNVQNGNVLLTGAVTDETFRKKAEELAWKVSGVKSVYNHITKCTSFSGTQVIKDSWITTKIKTCAFGEENVSSTNYSVKTVDGVVYLMGIAQSKEELEKVIKVCKTTSGVKKVISMVDIKQK